MEYFIKASAILILFYLFYKLLLQKETFFQLNRVFLLVGLTCSVLLPLIVIPVYVEIPATNFTDIDINFYGMTNTPVEASIDWIQIVAYLYIGGLFIFSSKLVISSYSLLKLFLNNPITKRSNGISYIETTNNNSPFSIFNYIVYNPTMFTKDELRQVITHEKVHINQQHSIDVIASEIIKTIFWFNPFVWMYTKEIHQNLEYIADSTSIKQTNTTINYQHLLLKTCFPNYQYSLTNKFYNSLIKKRITMLQKNRSSKLNQWKLTLIVPVLVAFVFTFNTKTIAQTTSQATDTKTELKSTINEKNDNSNYEHVKIGYPINNKRLHTPTKSYNLGPSEQTPYQQIISSNTVKIAHVLRPDSNLKIRSINNESDSLVQVKKNKPLLVINGHVSFLDPEDLNKDRIESITVLKDESATKKYGDKGKNGVIEIITKKNEEIKVIGYELPADSNIYIGSPTNNNLDSPLENDGKYGTSNGSDDKNKTIVIRGEIGKNGEKPLMIIDGKENSKNIKDLNPDEIFSIDVLKDPSATDKYGEKGKNGVLIITTKDTNKKTNNLDKNIDPLQRIASMQGENTIYMVDGVESSKKEVLKLKSNNLTSINAIKGEAATKKYGDKGKNGVVEITTKKK